MFRSNISKETISTDINMVNRIPANEYHEMLPYYKGNYEPRRNNIDVESAKELTVEKPMIEKRRFGRIKDMILCKSYIKQEEVHENKEIFVYGFKHNKTDEIDNYIWIGCESDEFFENEKLFNFSSNKFLNEDIQKIKFKITRWFFYDFS